MSAFHPKRTSHAWKTSPHNAQKVSGPCTCQAVVRLVKALASLLTKLPLPCASQLVKLPLLLRQRMSRRRHELQRASRPRRVQQVSQHFVNRRLRLTDVAHLLGYSTLASFSAWYRGRFDETPTRARRRQWQPEERGRLERQ